MDWYEIELDGDSTIKFPERIATGPDFMGGIIHNGRLSWLAVDATLFIYSMDNGQRVAEHTFWRPQVERRKQHNSNGTSRRISLVEELFPERRGGRLLLAVCLKESDRSHLAIFTPTNSQVLRYIDLHGAGISVRSFVFLTDLRVQQFDGCLAIGTDKGRVLLMDLMAEHVVATRCTNLNYPEKDVMCASVHQEKVRTTFNSIALGAQLQRCQEENIHFALELNLFANVMGLGVSSLMQIEFIGGLAIGLEDGRILIYDFNFCQIITQIHLPPEESPTVVERMCCILPPDDPKPCFYICAIYNQGARMLASLHSMNYSRGDDNFGDFQGVSSRIRLVLEDGICSLTSCSTASTFAQAGDNGTLLTFISWYSHTEQKNKLIFFDINQWYKDEMPCRPKPHQKPNYLCGYFLSGLHVGLSLQLDAKSIMHFLPLIRYDEHFYPNTLSFACSLLTKTGCRSYYHVGLQRRFIHAMYSQRANIFLNPQPYQEQIMRLCLMPQFYEHNPDSMLSHRDMYEVILSVALENNCIGLLKVCAQNCLDGSFQCNKLSRCKLSLSVLTHWIVKRAEQIKERCSEICQGIFDYGGYTLDDRERKEFSHLNVQLLKLETVQAELLQLGNNKLDFEVLEDLQFTDRALKTLCEYQSLLIWLIETDLLPEGQEDQQPLQQISNFYADRRVTLGELNCKLYIDEFLRKSSFNEHWKQSASYPPHSFQSLMHLMLLTDIPLIHKQELIMYILLDLDELKGNEGNKKLFKSFTLRFSLSNPIIVPVQSFWCLDRGNFKQTIEELRKTGRSICEKWQTTMLIKTMLSHGAVREALRVVNMPPGPIPLELKVEVLLENHNIPEAFHIARLYDDEQGRPLLEYFFNHCIRNRKFQVLASLYLQDYEEQMMYRLLKQCNTRQTDCVQLILLLKRCKYIEAVSFMDDVAEKRMTEDNEIDDTSAILAAYRATMAPVTQTLAGKYFSIRENLQGENLRNVAPEPFSCQLAKEQANGQLGSIFQSSALSAHWATRHGNDDNLNTRNMPFLRNASQASQQLPPRRRLVRPLPFQYLEKRQVNPTVERNPPVKRPCLIGDQIEEDVRDLIKRSAELKQEKELEKIREEEQNLPDERQVQALLQAPTYLQANTNRKEVQIQRQMPHTILKRPPSVVAEPRRIYTFSPPIPLGESMVMEDDEEETDEIIVEIQQQQPGGSCSNPESLSESDSDSEYLSPMASANVSQVDQKEPMTAPPTGPQPRNSLFQGRSDQEHSSGFGSFATIQLGNTGSLRSAAEFVPPVCSSKMCELQPAQVRMAERTTICVDSDMTSVVSTHSMALWPLPSTSRLGQSCVPENLQMLDTTLDMSSYDVTSPEQHAAEPPYKDLADKVDQQVEEDEQVPEQQQEALEQNSNSNSSSDQAVELAYPQGSPSYSVSSELSDISSEVTPGSGQEAPVYSIVVESTNSITTSRSPTSHTPTSFLPSDTNVSQNSSPRREGSNRSLYRANSLETVDDLDTTKGSMEEDDDNVEDDDECVIALDGTEVRGYVARPEPLVACNSAELFAFKQNDESVDQTAHLPCPSLGATANSDSIQAYTINLDSVESAEEISITATPAAAVAVSDPGSSNDSVATVAFSEHKQHHEMETDVEIVEAKSVSTLDSDSDIEMIEIPNSAAEQQTTMDSDLQIVQPSVEQPIQEDLEPEPAAYSVSTSDTDLQIVEQPVQLQRETVGEPDHGLRLVLSDDEEEEQNDHKSEVSLMPVIRILRTRRSQTGTPPASGRRLRSDDHREASVDSLSRGTPSPPNVITRRRRLRSDDHREASVDSLSHGTPSPANVMTRRRRLRSDDQREASVDSLSHGSPSPANVMTRRRRLRSDDQREPSVDSLSRDTPSPANAVIRRRSLRSGSHASEEQLATPPVTTPRRTVRLRSDDSVEDPGYVRVVRAGSMPAMPTIPVSTPKRRTRLVPKPLEAIQEGAELSTLPRTRSRTLLGKTNSSRITVSPNHNQSEEQEQRNLRSNSEPPATGKPPVKPTRTRKRSVDATISEPLISSASPSTRYLRSRRNTSEMAADQAAASHAPSISPEVSHMPETSVPPKKRGRPKK